MTYLDNCATAMPLQTAIDAAAYAMARSYGNPSSIHAMGTNARKILETARESVAKALGCTPARLTFTSGGTESANTAIIGAAMKNRHLGKHIVSTAVEHDATLSTLNALSNQGFEITLVPPQRSGVVSAEKITEAIRDDTILLAMQAVNNETGAVMPYSAAASALKSRNRSALFYLDAVQGFCKLPLSLENVDLLAISGHKIGGIKGAGALYAAEKLTLRAHHHGGGQEGGFRSGTEAVPAIAAFGVAAKYRLENAARDHEQLTVLKEQLLHQLNENSINYLCNSPENSAPHVVSISPQKGRSEVYIRFLSDMGIYVSGGSACKRGKRSHVLTAMNLPAAQVDSALRVSFCPENTLSDVNAFCEAFKEAQKLF